MSASAALKDLDQFTGSETAYRHALMRGISFTEGVHYVAEQAGAYWLVDIVATNQLEAKVRDVDFQVWKLVVTGSRAVLTCTDDDGAVIHTQDIGFTDFPEPGVTLWFTNNTILLPTEY